MRQAGYEAMRFHGCKAGGLKRRPDASVRANFGLPLAAVATGGLPEMNSPLQDFDIRPIASLAESSALLVQVPAAANRYGKELSVIATAIDSTIAASNSRKPCLRLLSARV
jgi:hypothetical protein